MALQAHRTDYDSLIENALRGAHLDASSAYYSKLLVTSILSEFFRYEYPETKWANGEAIDIDTSPDPGAAAVAWNMITQTGDPGDGIVTDNTDDLPQADISLEQNMNVAYEVPVMIQWTDLDIDRSRMQGVFSMAVEKGAAAKEYWLQRINKLIVHGSSVYNFAGVATMPGRHNIAATAAFSTLSSDQILQEFQRMFDAVYGGTDGVLFPNSVAMPPGLSGKLRMPTNALAVRSTFDFLKEQYPEITNWFFDPAMSTAGVGGTPAIMMYRKDASRVRALMPLIMTPKNVQEYNMKYRMIFRSRFAGIACPQPKNIVTMHGV